MATYEQFLEAKAFIDKPSGFDAAGFPLGSGGTLSLFPFQDILVRWALKRGRAAIFADTGMGKTAMQSAWAYAVHQYTGNRVLILAPLCVATQTVEEAAKFGVHMTYVREMPEEGSTGIFITNYEMLEHFEPWIAKGYFDGIVLDESSILKSNDSKTRARIIQVCKSIPYKLSCTATPSPNDYVELGNQSEFLGVMSSVEMLAMFFTHDSGETSKWRLKGHGKTRFWEWMSLWAVCIRKPSDLGFSDEGYILPGLEIDEVVIKTGSTLKAQSLSERNTARRETIDARVAEAARIANESDEPVLVWCNLNDESEKLKNTITGSVEVKGSDKLSVKESRLTGFTHGEIQKLVTKPLIAGYGLNWQHCSKMIFVGLNDSYEQLYQAIRRCYRFGQKNKVRVTLITADIEGAVLDNIKRKQAQHDEMAQSMVEHMRDFTKRQVVQLTKEKSEYQKDSVKTQSFELHLGDCVDVARSLPDNSVDYSVFSPPFSSLYTYSNSDRDMGNCKNDEEFWTHFRFLIAEYLRFMRPGRNVSIHCMNLPTSKQNHGYIGIRDFRGDIIREFQKAGFIYHSEVCVWKDPVVAMQRTKALGLLWKQIKKDSAMSRQGIPDYVVTFRKPGENTKRVAHTPEEFPVNEWQKLASPCWMDIKQSNTLNRKSAREEKDERHICPLQLDLIERLLFLWSIPGDVVFSPFTGIGSEGYVALHMGRKFIGSELKPSYFNLAKSNLESIKPITYKFPMFSKSDAHKQISQEIAEESDPAQMNWIDESSSESVLQ
jgi:DNA modification methylase